jgi:dolichol-phosphate mannosyltransferase
VTVVLPFYNEEALLPGLPDLLHRLRAALEGHAVTLLAVDDGSTDATAAGLAGVGGLDAVVRHERNRGVGAAITTGLGAAEGECAVVYDPDEAYPARSVRALVEALDRADVATLSPYHPEGGVEGVGPLRRLLSRAASRLYRRRLKSSLHTFTCAVRAYRVERVRPFLPAPDDFTASAYLLARAVQAGLEVAEVPAVLSVRREGRSKMRLLRTIRAHLRLLRDLAVTPPRSNAGP